MVEWGTRMGAPEKQGLYDPRNEHDACGVGFVANIKGRKSHEVVACGLEILINLDHRGAVGADPLVGDPVYGRRRSGDARLDAFPRQALHAFRLGLVHPASGEAMEWSVPLAADFAVLLDSLGVAPAVLRAAGGGA